MKIMIIFIFWFWTNLNQINKWYIDHTHTDLRSYFVSELKMKDRLSNDIQTKEVA